MPMIRYKCQSAECGLVFQVLIKNAKDIEPSYVCKDCSNISKRLLSAPNSSSKITVGRDTQARQVEIYPDVVELNHERARKSTEER